MGQMNVVDISGPDATHNVIRNYAHLGGVFGLIKAHLDELVEATREGKEKRIENALQRTDNLSKQVPLKALFARAHRFYERNWEEGMMSEDVFDMIIHNINNASGVADDAQGNLEGEFQTIVPGGYLGNVEIWSKQIDEEDGTSFLYLALDAYEEVEDLDLAYDDAFTSVEDWEDEVTKAQHSAELEKELNETLDRKCNGRSVHCET